MAKSGLAMQTEKLNAYTDEFLSVQDKITMTARNITSSKQIFKFIKPGQDIATVIVYIKQGGLVTITYKTGRNPTLGKLFHDFLENKCEPEDANKVNLVLKGMSSDNITFVLDLMLDELLEGETAFSITIASPTEICQKYIIACARFKDSIVLMHHTTTHTLQIQGRALFCYRTLCYHLSSLLDQQSLLAVVKKTSAEDRVILHEGVASNYIRKALPNAFDRLDDTYRNLLSSSYCVKLANPILTEYSMLIYPDLRVLEGVIREAMAKNGLYTSSEKIDIGHYFTPGQNPELKTGYNSNFQCEKEILCLEGCYDYFKTHRHSLFHMGENGYESRTTDTIGEVMQISEKIAELVDALYSACNKL